MSQCQLRSLETTSPEDYNLQKPKSIDGHLKFCSRKNESVKRECEHFIVCMININDPV